MPVLQSRGVELSWSERGEGSPLVLVHETASSSAAWERLSGAAPERMRAIAYDRRGWGSSTAPDGYRRTTIEEQSEDAAVLIESLDAAPAAVCGAGLGAIICLDLLLRRPELVSGAILIEPPVLSLLPEATEALSDDHAALQQAFHQRGAHGAVSLYLSGRLGALGVEAARLPSSLTGEARERPAILFAELGAAAAWSMPLVQFASAERRSLVVGSTATPQLVREAGRALISRLAASEAREVTATRAPPHVGAPEEVSAMVLELAPSADPPGGAS